MTRVISKGILFLLITLSFGKTSFGQSTTIPVMYPFGFRIDGYLQRQGEAGDWFAGPGGNAPGSFIFDDAGNSFALHFTDRWDSDSDNVFFKGRFGDDPSTMKWTLKKSQAKGDINHTMGFLAGGSSGGILLILAGDRLGSNNTSYLDFELMQKAVVRVGNSDNGGFYSFGRDGGRTVGDLNISVKFDKHATEGNIKVFEWQRTNSISGFGYVPINVGNIFSAVNNVPVTVPFGAFGSTVYPPFTFAELAIEIGIISGSCSNANGYRTVWMQSKSDDSYHANLIDFAETTQLPINPAFSVSVDYVFYDLQHAQLTANVLPGPVEDYNFFWLPITPLTGSLSDPNISNPVFTTGTDDYCLSYIYELYVYRKSDNCLISITPVVINAPCKIGKPINPDRPNFQMNLMEEANTKNEIHAYPNPSNGTLNIVLPVSNGPQNIELIDMKGSVIQRWKEFNGNTITFKRFQNGLYLLKMQSATTGKTITQKIIINR